MPRRYLVFAIVIALMLAPGAILAAKKKAATAPAPAPAQTTIQTPATKPDSLALASTQPSGVARTPGPLVTPGSPTADRTTIAPFPIPGDTSRAARTRAKLMNVPREGVTALEPLPPGTAPHAVDALPNPYLPPAPEYPKAARDAGIQGTVVVEAHLTIAGTVDEVRVMKSIPALDDAAMKAVGRMRFSPAYFRGKPYAVWVVVPVKFTIH